MHISIFVYGTWGDLRPHVALGVALQAAGHDVQVVAAKVFEEWVRARNLGFYPLSVDVNQFISDMSSRDVVNPVQQLRIFREEFPPLFTQMGLEVLEATRDSDILMTVEFGLSVLMGVVQANNLKTILINPAPLNPTREFASAAMLPAPPWFPFKAWYNRLSYTLVQRLQWSLLDKPRNELQKNHLRLPKNTFKEFQATLEATPALTAVSPQLVQRPADWYNHWQVTGYLFDDDPDWIPPQELSDFLATGEKPIYIGFGSMLDSNPKATTRTIIDAGFRAGVPTIIVPHSADQPYWGRCAKQLGVGTDPIPRKQLTVDKLAAAIQEATTNRDMQAKAKALGEKIAAEDGRGSAVKAVREFLM